MSYKTLEELNPKVGDIVVYRGSAEYTVGPNQTLVFPKGYCLKYEGWDTNRCFTLKEKVGTLDISGEWKMATKNAKIGSLKEIGAKVGDTVELVKNGLCKGHEIGSVGVVTNFGGELRAKGENTSRGDIHGHKFKIINSTELPYGHVRLPDGSTIDLTAIEKPFGLLSQDVKSALINCKLPYQNFRNNGCWDVNDKPYWVESITYRVKPQPKVEVEKGFYGAYGYNNGGLTANTHSITFNLIDGVPDCNSIKMEKLK